MDSHEEDGEIREDVRHVHINYEQDYNDDDDFSMSSYDGEQGDSLDIKPPQAVVQRREKRDKREKRERHRHKGDRHKDRHRSREHRAHDERRREHRRHRDREREVERRESGSRRHEKHRERSKQQRSQGDLRHKLDKDRKQLEREAMKDRKQRERERDDYAFQERDYFERVQYHREYHQVRGGGGLGGGGGGSSSGGGGGGGGSSGTGNVGVGMETVYQRREDRQVPPMSPRERTERDKRMERFMIAEKQKEMSQREAESRRQKREEERREAEMEEIRQRQEGQRQSNEGHYRDYPQSPEIVGRKRRKHQAHQMYPEYEELDNDDDEVGYKESRVVEETRKKKKKRKKDEVEEEDEEEEVVEEGSVEEVSPSDSASEESDTRSGSATSDNDTEDEVEEEEAAKRTKEKASAVAGVEVVRRSQSGSTSGSRSASSSPVKENNESYTPRSQRSDRDDAHPFVNVSPAQSPLEQKEQLPCYYPALMGCRSVDEFECLNRIEEGTYGVVYRAREKATSQIVALKRLKMEKEKEGFPITSLREVNTLLKGQHENIVTVREIVVGSNMDKIYIVMDYVEHDLKSLMETMRQKKQMFTIGEVKTLMIQLLKAVAHLHDNWILHRDLKTSNLLLSHRGILKVGDFGLAREYGSPLKGYTPIVVTLWYRAPELLLGAKEYSTHIDVWSVGCIFGELLGMEPMFPGKNELDQLNKIFKDLGTPSEKIWPGYPQLPVVKKTQFADYPYNHLRERFKSRLSDQGFSLLNRFLTYNPMKRITCEEARKHDYFRVEVPLPISPSMFPTWPAKSENPHPRSKKGNVTPKPPSGGKNFKDLGDGDDEVAAKGFFVGGSQAGPGFTLKF
ncbi:cyclin dependent kinase 11B pitslre isoform X2 [Oratosquilla oratoria]|uniref:cyclin dependent kinase 11B pitslre isoform X2 n=1 Tax=Oratosquilla oratoria TaxID=337810 RepID=UPI003F766FA4